MSKKREMRKPANATGLNSDRPGDVKALKHLRELVDVVPGCSDVTGALRWLCEDEVPLIIEKYKRLKKALKTA